MRTLPSTAAPAAAGAAASRTLTGAVAGALAWAVAAGVLLAGCSGKAPSTADALPTLAPDPLASLVPQPREVPTGLILVVAQSGPASADRLASFSGSGVAAAKAKLVADGYRSAYVAEYASRGGRTLTVVVTRFATAAGAASDLAPDLSGTTPVAGLGDASGRQTQALPGGPTGGQLVTERFRVGTLTYLIAVGGPMGVDVDDVTSVAKQLAARGSSAAGG